MLYKFAIVSQEKENRSAKIGDIVEAWDATQDKKMPPHFMVLEFEFEPAEAEELVYRLNELESSLNMAKDLKDLKDLKVFLEPILDQDGGKKRRISDFNDTALDKKTAKTPAGIRFFRLDEGWDVMVGKTDKANDHLTRDIAGPEDIWLHVYNAPGSHVVLKNPRRLETVPFDILKKAACIAAFFSRQKNEDKVLVCYTRKKFVRKPKGMKPGQVLVERQKTLLVKPGLNKE